MSQPSTKQTGNVSIQAITMFVVGRAVAQRGYESYRIALVRIGG